jgi:hypothetical protein
VFLSLESQLPEIADLDKQLSKLKSPHGQLEEKYSSNIVFLADYVNRASIGVLEVDFINGVIEVKSREEKTVNKYCN